MLNNASQPESDPDNNRRMYVNQAVVPLAIMGMTTMGWLDYGTDQPDRRLRIGKALSA